MSRAPRAPKRENWEVEQQGEAGDFEVRQGRKVKGTFPHERKAIEYISKYWSFDQQVFLVEPDGYRMNITRRFVYGGSAPKTR